MLTAVFVVAAAFSYVAFIGGTPDFEGECDANGVFTVRNTSSGSLSNPTWDVEEYMGPAKYSGSGNKFSWSDSDENSKGLHIFKVTLTVRTFAGTEHSVTKDLIRDGYTHRLIEWKFNGEDYSIAISIKNSDFADYKNMDADRAPGWGVNATIVGNFVTTTQTTNGAFESIVNQFKDQFEKYGLTGLEDQVNCIMAFVENIGYLSDLESTGQDEYWKFPIETLFTQGDCEDLAMLTMALFRETLDLPTALLVYWDINNTGEGHAMAAVDLGLIPHPHQDPENVSTGWYTTNGMTFCTCETTSIGWTVGEIPQLLYDIEEDRIIVVPA